MCHLVLLMPLFGLALFPILPLPVASPLYLMVVAASVLVYYKAYQAMKQPIQVGREALVGKTVEVVAVVDTPSLARYLVREGGELWSASSSGHLRRGDKAVVKRLEGTRLVLMPVSGDTAASAIGDTTCR